MPWLSDCHIPYFDEKELSAVRMIFCRSNTDSTDRLVCKEERTFLFIFFIFYQFFLYVLGSVPGAKDTEWKGDDRSSVSLKRV